MPWSPPRHLSSYRAKTARELGKLAHSLSTLETDEETEVILNYPTSLRPTEILKQKS